MCHHYVAILHVFQVGVCALIVLMTQCPRVLLCAHLCVFEISLLLQEYEKFADWSVTLVHWLMRFLGKCDSCMEPTNQPTNQPVSAPYSESTDMRSITSCRNSARWGECV